MIDCYLRHPLWEDLEKKFVGLQRDLKKIDPKNSLLKYRSVNEVIDSPEYEKRTGASPLDVQVYLTDVREEIVKIKKKSRRK